MSVESTNRGGDVSLSDLLDVHIPGEKHAVAEVTDSISAILTNLDVPEEKRMEIALAVQEALANAVVHGCKSDPTKKVRCRLQRDPKGRIVITITDPGPGFQPEAIADPKKPENISNDHGRGVYLIHRLMDEVHFEQGGSEIRMWKY